MKSEFKKSVAGLTLAVATMTSTAALAAVDLTPWKNAAGPNTGLTPDITLSTSPVQDLTPVQVDVSVCNRGDETVTSSTFAPIEVKLFSAADLYTDADASFDTKALADGVSIAPGACTSVSFTWIPDVAQGISDISARVNPQGYIIDADFSNDVTTRAVTFDTQPPVVPEMTCHGFYAPFDKDITISNKTKRAIPVKLELFDEYGQAQTDYDISSPPVINVTFNSTVYGSATTDDATLDSVGSSNDGNQFSFNSAEQLWEYRLGTKQFSSAGTYQVTVTSGDTNEYTINNGTQCTQSFTRQE